MTRGINFPWHPLNQTTCPISFSLLRQFSLSIAGQAGRLRRDQSFIESIMLHYPLSSTPQKYTCSLLKGDGLGLHSFNPFHCYCSKDFPLNKNNIFLYRFVQILHLFSSAKRLSDENMTNVKLIIYLSQSHTLNRPRCLPGSTNALFIYVMQLFHVIAKSLPRVVIVCFDIQGS